MSVLKVYLNEGGDNWIKLIQTNEDKLDDETDGWRSANASTPFYYYQDKERDILGIYPKANTDNVGTSYLHIYYANDFTSIANDVDELVLPWKMQLGQADFVVATCYETRGWGDKANDAWAKYNSKLRHYVIERDTEKQVDDEGLIMKNYKNID